jgi:glucan endo-1,3-beta-D-glucosidase
MPPVSPLPDISPVKLRSPGGITVSSIGQQAASAGTSANDVFESTIVGSVPSVQYANRYSIVTVPCAAGQRVAYKLDSAGGLEMNFFQMTTPALGLFMSVS